MTVFSLQGRRYQSWAEIAGLLPAWLPALAVEPGGVVEFDQPDAAFTSQRGQLTDADGRIIVSGQGLVEIEAVVENKRWRLDTAFAIPPQLPLAQWAVDWLDPYWPADQVAAGLVLATQSVNDERVWDEVVTVLADRAGERLAALAAGTATPGDGEIGLLLAGLAATGWTFEGDQADLVVAALVVAGSRAGVGLGFAHAWVIGLLHGRDPAPLRRLMAQVAAQRLVPEPVAELEWATVTGQAWEASALSELMLVLGAGLPGSLLELRPAAAHDRMAPDAGTTLPGKALKLPLAAALTTLADRPAIAPDRVARAVAVAAILPDQARLTEDWPMSLRQAAQQASWRLQAQPPEPGVWAWLALAQWHRADG
jgi:hypothetical protein